MKNLKKIVIRLVCLMSLVVFSHTLQATTINVTMPSPTLGHCQNLSALDTFVFHKPSNYGSTNWYCNYTLQITADTFMIVPATVGSFTIACAWNTYSETCILNVFTSVPSHPLITILSGGNYNAVHDTVRMCSTSVSMNTNVNSSNITSMQWLNPSGTVIATTANITITTPGRYIFLSSNACGTERDTIYFIALPYTLSIIGPADTTFCNTTVSLLLDPGPGWNYSWTGGIHTQTYSVTDTGTYTVQLSNACLTGSRTINVHRESYPIPAMNHMVGSSLCSDSIVTLNPAFGYHYNTYTWSTGSHNDSIQISGLTTGGGLFTVTVTQGVCSETAFDAYYVFYQPPMRPEICIVTVDSVTQKDMVVWTADAEPPTGSNSYSNTAFYYIYKDLDTLNAIGSVTANLSHVFVDTTSTPPFQSATYYIKAVDDCGFLSQKSFYHQTILLQTSQGSTPGQVNLAWNQYQDESGLFHLTSYDVYRGNSMGNLQYYRTVPAPVNPSIAVLVVDTVSSQQYYQIVATKSGGCDPTPHLKSLNNGIIRSNIKEGILNGISDISQPKFSIYPNPSPGIFHIEGTSKILQIKVFDNLGKLIYTSTSTTDIDLGQFDKGIYYALIQTSTGSTNRLLIKN